MTPPEIDKLAKILWDYHFLGEPISPANLIFAMGSSEIRIVDKVVQLYFENYAPLIMFSGGYGKITKGKFTKTEAETFADIAISQGVPPKNIIVETKSTNTMENIEFSRRLLQEKNIEISKIILVTKPYMERRGLATFGLKFPGVDICVTSPDIDYQNAPTTMLSSDDVINLLVGDLQRIKIFSGRSMIPQIIPPQVEQAYNQLVKLGYTKFLLTDTSEAVFLH